MNLTTRHLTMLAGYGRARGYLELRWRAGRGMRCEFFAIAAFALLRELACLPSTMTSMWVPPPGRARAALGLRCARRGRFGSIAMTPTATRGSTSSRPGPRWRSPRAAAARTPTVSTEANILSAIFRLVSRPRHHLPGGARERLPFAGLREAMLDLLRCPGCLTDRPFQLAVARRNAQEVRSATLTCCACLAAYTVDEGIVDLLAGPPDHVVREAAGLERFAARMRADGWTSEMVAGLPDSRTDLDYWKFAGDSMRALLDSLGPRPGERVVDVGSNTCWAAGWFARLGLEVVALDIARAELQGLRTAEFHLAQGVYYERLLSTMAAPALASDMFDYAFCCEVLHHNDPQELRATLRELHRILRPGGRLLVINEPMRFPLQLKPDHAQEVAEYEGHEHVYFLHEYLCAARRAGFHVRLRELVDEPFFDDRPLPIWREASVAFGARQVLKHALRRRRVGRRAYLYYKSAISGDVPLSMIATKPQA